MGGAIRRIAETPPTPARLPQGWTTSILCFGRAPLRLAMAAESSTCVLANFGTTLTLVVLHSLPSASPHNSSPVSAWSTASQASTVVAGFGRCPIGMPSFAGGLRPASRLSPLADVAYFSPVPSGGSVDRSRGPVIIADFRSHPRTSEQQVGREACRGADLTFGFDQLALRIDTQHGQRRTDA